jgi:uncharacterized membrane protein
MALQYAMNRSSRLVGTQPNAVMTEARNVSKALACHLRAGGVGCRFEQPKADDRRRSRCYGIAKSHDVQSTGGTDRSLTRTE